MLSLNSLKNLFWLIKHRNTFKNWKKRKFNAPSPEFIKHQILRNNNLNDSLWIETGTYYGNTTKELSKIASKVISIEADKRLYDLAIMKFKNDENIKIINGKSEDVLSKIFLENKEFKNVCIYLDAHLCIDHLTGLQTFGEEKSGTPLSVELNIIEENLVNFQNIKIMIDDIRLFDKKFKNYTSKNNLIHWCAKHNFNWNVEHDIMIIDNLI